MHPTAFFDHSILQAARASLGALHLVGLHVRLILTGSGLAARPICSSCRNPACRLRHSPPQSQPSPAARGPASWLFPKKLAPYRIICRGGNTHLAEPVIVGGRPIATLVAYRVNLSAGTKRCADHTRACRTLLAGQVQEITRRLTAAQFRARLDDHPAIASAKHYVADHLPESRSTRVVARAVGLSEGHFCRRFRRATGLTLVEYVARARVNDAQHRLADPLRRITEVALDTGFGSLDQFERAFRRFTGQTPTQWCKCQALCRAPHFRDTLIVR